MYWKRNLDNRSCIVPVGSFFSSCLTTCTALSVRPLDEGWYGATVLQVCDGSRYDDRNTRILLP